MCRSSVYAISNSNYKLKKNCDLCDVKQFVLLRVHIGAEDKLNDLAQ